MEHHVHHELASGSPEVPNYPGWVYDKFIRYICVTITKIIKKEYTTRLWYEKDFQQHITINFTLHYVTL